MRRLVLNTSIALALGLGLTIALLWVLDGPPLARAEPSNGTTRYVAHTGDDSGSFCTSPITPCRTVQQAVNMAWSGNDEVLVAAGVYTSASGQVLFIQNRVTVRGGYTTTNNFADPPDPDGNPTILDGRGLMRVVYINGDITPTLEGLRLTNGSVNGDGGGIYSVNAHPVISGCHIYLNTAISTNDDGGGVYLANGHHAILTGNEIYSNTAGWNGGGVSLYQSDDVRLTANRIYHNITENGGGGISHENSDDAKLIGNQVLSNTAGWYGGGIYFKDSNNAALTGNLAFSNTTNILGGGLYLGNSLNATLMDNQIYRNRAVLGGGGILLNSSTVTTLVNNMVVENQISGGGDGVGIRIANSDVHLLHSTIARNSGGNRQGIYVSGASATVWMTNTILVSHTVGIETSGGAVVTATHTLWGAGTWANVTDTVGSNIFTGTLAANWWEEPGFLNPDGGNYHVGGESGPLNKGLDTGLTTDIDGDLRPFCDGVDLGADETACCANLNSILYPTVQAAVDASTAPSDIVKVAGTCAGVNNRGGDNQTVYISKTMSVRGGYTTADWNTSNPQANPTTLDAVKQGRVVCIEGSNDISPTLEGLQVINSSTNRHGGGIYAQNASPIISGCQIYSNTAWSGGGVTLYEASEATLNNNDIHDNAARWGGGIKVDSSPFVVLSDNNVYRNEATISGGGGIHLADSHTATLSVNDIYSNTANDGGGVSLVDSIDVTLTGNTIYKNSATADGGGVYMDSGNDIRLDNNVIAENQASGNGSGVYMFGGTAHLRHTTIARNSDQQGVYAYLDTATIWLTNTILVSHTVGIETDFGATAYLTATLWGEGTWANETPTLGSNIFTGTVNVWGAPDFVAPDDGDYHIGADSAAIGRGVSTSVTTDIDGETRLGADEGLPELALTKWGPAWLNQGQHYTYTLTITNTGAATATNVVLTDAVPSLAQFLWASDNGTVTVSSVVTWPAFIVAPGGGVITRTFAVKASSAITNSDYRATAQGMPSVVGTVVVTNQLNTTQADVGTNQSLHSGVVTLDGSSSYDPEGHYPLEYEWWQSGGPITVTLHNVNTAVATFTAPSVAGFYWLRIRVTDALGATDTDLARITVTNTDPVADAGAAQSVAPDTTITLDGSGSYDPDGDALAYGWEQTGGPPITLSSYTAVSPTFTSPITSSVMLTFTLTVSDTFNTAHSAVTTVTVKHYVYLPLVLRNY